MQIDSGQLIAQIVPVMTLLLSGGGLKVVFDYVRERREFHATTQDGLIKELNRMIEDERRRCQEQMANLQERIRVLETQVASLQNIPGITP